MPSDFTGTVSPLKNSFQYGSIDLHLENLWGYEGNKRPVCIALNDFDYKKSFFRQKKL